MKVIVLIPLNGGASFRAEMAEEIISSMRLNPLKWRGVFQSYKTGRKFGKEMGLNPLKWRGVFQS